MPSLYSSLTPREKDVLRLLCSGLNNTEIGQQLNLRPRTIDAYVSNMRYKLNMTTAGMVKHAIIEGISQL